MCLSTGTNYSDGTHTHILNFNPVISVWLTEYSGFQLLRVSMCDIYKRMPSTNIYQHLPLPTSTDIYRHLPTSTNIYNIYQHLPTSTNTYCLTHSAIRLVGRAFYQLCQLNNSGRIVEDDVLEVWSEEPEVSDHREIADDG